MYILVLIIVIIGVIWGFIKDKDYEDKQENEAWY